jgi:tRNA U34 5-methylaminomethyl-2-thiouridine-forming methyltransferase MnmC
LSESTNTDLSWRDGIPISQQFDDPYFSLNNGLAETQHVFIAGNRLRERWVACSPFHIAELGFGTGLNALATIQAFRQDNPTGHLYFTSFERYPLNFDVMQKALTHFNFTPEYIEILRPLSVDGGLQPVELPELTIRVIVGDANQTLSELSDNTIHAWYLDGFSPAKNPELWNLELMQSVYQKTAPLGTFATYSAAGWVRRMLQDAGFEVHKQAGYGFKRHMSVGCKY